jgi:hypothetical protein
MPNVLKQQEGAADEQWLDAGNVLSLRPMAFPPIPHCLALPPPATGDHAAAPLRCEVEQPLLFFTHV